MIMFFIGRMRSQNALIRLSKVVEHRLSVAKHDEIYKECVRCGLGSALAKFHVHTSCSFSKKKKVSDEQSKAQELSYISTKKRKKVIEIWPRMTVEELSRAMKKTTDNVLELMTFVDDTAGITNASDVIDDWDTLCDVVVKANFRWKVCSRPSEKQRMNAVADLSATLDADSDRRTVALSEELLKRPPVVAIMGHVDHGKTTLLDYLRKSSIAASEFGGITQHIGAFSVKVGSSSITFLDTPGHAAFSAMRSRGAHCTDIVVLVVAADDGVMEQTVESIRMANDANVPIVIAINKIDKPSADIEKTKKMLTIQGLVLEEYGGDVQVIPISALHGTNISQLIEAILILSELHDLKAPVTGLVEGVILESKLDRHKGKLTTALIQRGTLRKGDILTAGLAWCKVKKLSDDRSRQITEASPSTPVEIIGWDSLPSPGDLLTQVESEQTAHEVTRFRRKNRLLDKAVNDLPFIESARAETRAYYEEHLVEKRRKRHAQIRWDEFRQKEIEKHVKETPTLNIVVKTDVEGSLEAIADMLRTYRCSLCDLNVVQSGVGNVSLADVEIAASFHAVVYSFNVGVLADAQDYANRHDIIIKHQNVVYQFLEDVKNEMNSRLPPKDVEEIIGEAIVQELFLISEGKKKKIPVAGCRCTKGELKKSSLYKVIRNDKELHRGTLSSMRNIKVEVTSVKKDQHCGLKFNDSSVIFQPGDIIKAYKMSQVPQKIEWNPF